MVSNEPVNIDIEEESEKGFPWVIILVIAVVIGLAGVWIYHAKSADTSAASALEQEVANERAVLENERDEVFKLTAQLEKLKYEIDFGKTPNRKEAVAKYNRLARQQREKRQKVKTLAEQYNKKVSQLHEQQ